ncbi:DUF4127 family protein [Paenibacillus sp. IB182496]|uniref:DUF4127 family protein n=1 Tax=Paenibacillus sabuli TaxID=2772509 RepID=A0A927BXH6_9BACL|nr:DUF4127 family protein [Paenibacillus sabuli]MBD2847535.1 DUF4127 family protein [Paenibacillus sabuli]
MKKVLYVPLDDRPVNLDDVVALGRTAGLEVYVPLADDIANQLDTRVYAEGTLVTGTSDPVYGKPERIRRFLQQHAARADGYVLAVDMLVYGGLIGSRRLRPAPGEHATRMNELDGEPDHHAAGWHPLPEEGEPGAIDIVAITAPEPIAAAMDRLATNGAAQQASIVLDFTGPTAHPDITAALLASPWTGRLLGYSAWNTAGNKIGIALGMGEARYAGLTVLHKPKELDAAMDAHGSLLFKRFLEDYYYKAVAIADIREFSRSRTPYTNVTADQQMRLFNTPADYDAAVALLRERMQAHTETLRNQPAFLGGERPACAIRRIRGVCWSLSVYDSAILPAANPGFPWGRAFEIDLAPRVALSPCPTE